MEVNYKQLITVAGFILAATMFGLFLVATRADEKAKGQVMEALTYGDTYVRRAKVLRWVDGDTVDLDIDLGFRVHIKERIRLLNVDTPERGQPDFDKATAMASKYAPVGSMCLLRTEPSGKGKYGRWLGIIYVPGMGQTLNDNLIEAGWPYKR